MPVASALATGSRTPTGKDRLINGDPQASGERFGRPPGDVGALVYGQHLCALYQDQDERRLLTAAVIRGALPNETSTSIALPVWKSQPS